MGGRLLLLLGILASCPVALHAAQSEAQLSLRYSCFNKPFLTVSAHVPRHDSFPAVDLLLTDPRGRSVGHDRAAEKIPNSQYGKTIEIPGHLSQSRAVAAEVCGAIRGDYILVVSEHDDVPYLISIGGNAAEGGDQFIIARFYPHGARTCRYRFSFLMDEGSNVHWLADAQHRGDHPVCELIAGK